VDAISVVSVAAVAVWRGKQAAAGWRRPLVVRSRDGCAR